MERSVFPFEEAFVQGFAIQHVDEARWMYERVAARAPKRVLEIGVAGGGTLRMWCGCAARGALVVGVDTFPDEYRDRVLERCRPVAEERGIQLKIVQGDSTGDSSLPAWELGPWDFVHVDGHHGYEYVGSDFRRALERLAPGGEIAFHDALDAGCADVARVLREAEEEGLVVERHWAGDAGYEPLNVLPGQKRFGYGVVSRRP